MGQYVAIDLHKRRSLIVRADEQGQRLETIRIDNDAINLASAVAAAGEDPEVVLEATCGWYWAADVLAEVGAKVHLAHPLGLHWDNRRVKNDVRDAMLCSTCSASGWSPKPGSLHPRCQSCASWSATGPSWSCSARDSSPRSKGSWAKRATSPAATSCGAPGRKLLKGSRSSAEAEELRRIWPRPLAGGFIEHLTDTEIASVGAEVAGWLDDDLGYRAIQAIKGVGPVLGAVMSSSPRSAGSTASPPPTKSAPLGRAHPAPS